MQLCLRRRKHLQAVSNRPGSEYWNPRVPLAPLAESVSSVYVESCEPHCPPIGVFSATVSRGWQRTHAPFPQGCAPAHLPRQLPVSYIGLSSCVYVLKVSPSDSGYGWPLLPPADFRLFQPGMSYTLPMICDLLVRSRMPPAFVYRRYFAELLPEYPDHSAVYSDGSFLKGSASSAFVFNGHLFSYRLHGFNVVLTVKLYAFFRGVCSSAANHDVTVLSLQTV